MAGDDTVTFTLWDYTPSIAGAVIAVIVFAVLTAFHGFKLVVNRTWFCIPLVIGGAFEAVGYAGRAAAHSDTKSTTPYIIQSILILLAPILFAASIYMVLGRLIRRTNSASRSMIRPQWVTRIFVAGDIFCFMIQGGGGGMMSQAKKQSDIDLGEHIILGGLVLQIFIFGFFVVLASVWHRRLSERPTSEATNGPLPWKRYTYLLYAASVCITIRNVCRCIEYGMGSDGYLLTHEWPLYIYDFVLMAVVLIVSTQFYDPAINPSKANDVGIQQWS